MNIQPLTCLPGCTSRHDPRDEFHYCTVPIGSVTAPSGAVVAVEVVRDLDLDGRLHRLGVYVFGPAETLPPEAARELAYLMLAAADRISRAN